MPCDSAVVRDLIRFLNRVKSWHPIGAIGARQSYPAPYRWDTARTIEGVVDIPGVGSVRYEVEQGPVTDWTIILGTNLEVADNFSLVLEFQFLDDVRMVLGSATYRF